MACLHLKDTDKIAQRVELKDDGYVIYGCRKGGCCIITGIRFCPFCGELLMEK